MTSERPLPLAGVRVLEFTHAVLGPACGLLLADFGAEVIRIERAPDGDPTRRLKGFGLGYNTYFNRNKKSFVVDLKSAEGKEIVHKLLGTADVLIENFGPGTMDRLGFGYDALKTDYPNLIYCALKGFLPGPYEKRMALDEVVQMMSGLAYMTGRPGDPLRAGASIVDIMTGMYGAIGTLLAIQERAKTGRGQLVRTALFETAAFIMAHHMTYAAMTQAPVPPMPARVSAWAIYHQFELLNNDRVFIGVTSDQQWQRFCDAFERTDLFNDARLATNNDRITHQDFLLPTLRFMLSNMSKPDVLARCEQANLPFSPITRPEDLFDDAQLNAGNSLIPITLPDGRETMLPRLPLQLDGQPFDKHSDAPQIAEHNAGILTELGYSTDEINQLAHNKIIQLQRTTS